MVQAFFYALAWKVDNQLDRIHTPGRRAPVSLTTADLPQVAKAITALIRGQARSKSADFRGRRYIRIRGLGSDVLIYSEDWKKIQPYIEDSTFSPLSFPVESGSQTLDPVTRFRAGTIDVKDPMYKRVLGVLQQEFTKAFPT